MGAMSEYDPLIEGYVGPLADPSADPGPLSDEEAQKLAESTVTAAEIAGETAPEPAPGPDPGEYKVVDLVEMTKEAWAEHDARDEPPHDPNDWPDEEPQGYAELPVVVDPSLPEGTVLATELRVLKPDQIPLVGVHYVVFNGVPRPVVRGNYAVSEDEHVRTQLGGMDDLKDADGQRRQRATRTIQMRYRGYLCGEVAGL